MSVFAQINEKNEGIAVEVIREINLVRANPSAYAENLASIRKNYKGTVYFSAEGQIRTFEGVSAIDEAISALRAAKPLPPLRYSEGMSRAAMDHVFDVGARGTTSHTGSDGSVPGFRLGRYGAWQDDVGENINFGRVTPREIVLKHADRRRRKKPRPS